MKIYNDDCFNIMTNIENNSVDCIITDPPYGIKYKTCRRLNKEHKFCKQIKNDDNDTFIENYIKECYRVLKNNSVIFLFCASTKLDIIMSYAKEVGFDIKNIVIWVKNNWTAGDLQACLGKQYECIIVAHKGRCTRKNNYRYSDVWNFDRVPTQQLIHQNQKPVDLLKRCIELYTNENDVVFDGCMGSGSTGVACKEMNRDFIGCEIDSEYFNIAKGRLGI